MSKTTAATIAELKRAGYPFDPTRVSNWYGGILASLLAKAHKTDRIDLLAERALKQMDILTRGNRRAIILRQVEKAIRSLCSKNLLNQYAPNRVRIQHGVTQAKLDRYLAEKPLPWAEEEAVAASGAPGDDPEGSSEADAAEVIAAQDDGPEPPRAVPDEDDEPLSSMPVGLPQLRRVDESGLASSPGQEEARWTDGGESTLKPEASRALARLLPSESDCAMDRMAPPASAGPHLPHEPAVATPAITYSPLIPLIDAIQSMDPSVQIRAQFARQAILIASEGCEIDIEWRRTGEVRAFVCFPTESLNNVLRHVGTTWADLRVALDQQGRSGIQRVSPSATTPNEFAVRLLQDLQVLDDAMGT